MGAFELVVSDQLLAEVERVLRRPKFAAVDEADATEFPAVIRDGAVRELDLRTRAAVDGRSRRRLSREARALCRRESARVG